MSPAYRFHPEFGYFCPTPSFRYKLRVALLFLVIGGIAGFGGMLVLKAAHHPATGHALTVARVDDSSSAGDAIASADHAESATIGQRSGASAGSKSACEDDTWAYLDGKCVSGKSRKARTVRTTSNRPPIAAVPLGSNALPPGRAVEPASAPLRAADRHQLPAGAVEAAPTNPGLTTPTEQAVAAPKKAQKTARRQSKGRDHRVAGPSGRDGRSRDNQSSARAYADDRSSQRGPFGGGGPFGDGGLFGSGGPFGSLFR